MLSIIFSFQIAAFAAKNSFSEASPTKIASNFVGLTSFVFSSVRTLFSGDSNENLVLLQVKSCANVARVSVRYLLALEILGLKKSIESSLKEHPCLSLMKSASLGVSALAIEF